MIELLSYSFIQNAIIGSFFTSVICGIIGTIVVVNRIVFLAGGIAHSVYGGVGISVFFGLPILLGSTLFSVICALILSYMLLKSKERIDSIIGSLWAFGMALGIILVELTPGYNKDFISFLFGSILSISLHDIYYMSSFSVCLVLFIFLFYKIIIAVMYDSDFAYLRGINTNLFSTILMVLIALGIVLSMQSVGIILIVALLSIPAYISELFCKNLYTMMLLSSFISFTSSILGIILAYFYNLQAGSSIVLVLSIISAIMFLCKYVYSKLIQRA